MSKSLRLNVRQSFGLRSSSSFSLAPVPTGPSTGLPGQIQDKFKASELGLRTIAGTTSIGLLLLVGIGGAIGRRTRRKPTNERGLPDNSALLALAKTYLETQLRLYGSVELSRLLPRADKQTAAGLVDEFRNAFLDLDWRPSSSLETSLTLTPVAAVYLRYSCDKSNPRSLDQQLRNCLEKAAQLGHWVPWDLVFADAAVSGTSAARRGYQMAKAAIEVESGRIELVLIDEIGRAARDAIETLKLGRLMDNCGSRLVGCTDGFDSSHAHSKMMLSMFAMVHEHFVDQLRGKVRRGTDDAFRIGKNIRPPSFGYKLVPCLDAQGFPILDTKGRVDVQKVIDEEHVEWVIKAFDMYVNGRKSPAKIAAYFNDHEVGGRRTWDGANVTQLLTRRTYIGEEVEGMTRTRVDSETGKRTTKKVPESEWKRRDVPHLRIISDEMFEAAQARRRQCRDAHDTKLRNAPARTSVYSNLLIRPVCSCGTRLLIGRTGEHKSLFCPSAKDHKHKCQMGGYKSVRIIESCILDHVRSSLTPACEQEVLERANKFLEDEISKPVKDTKPLERTIKELKKKVALYLDKFEENPSEAAISRVNAYEQSLKEREAELRDIQSRQLSTPVPLDAEAVSTALDQIRQLLNSDKESAAPIIEKLVGQVVVSQTTNAEKKRVWTAKFSINLIPVIAELTARSQCLNAPTWEYLHLSDWTLLTEAIVPLETVPPYVQIAPELLRLHTSGASIESLAALFKKSTSVIRTILKFAQTGEKPQWEPKGKKRDRRKKGREKEGDKVECKYLQFGELIAERRELGETFREIRDFISNEYGVKMSHPTAVRAYDHARPAAAIAAAASGRMPSRNSKNVLRPEQYDEIRRLLCLQPRVKYADIAAQVGCSAATVSSEKRRMTAETKDEAKRADK